MYIRYLIVKMIKYRRLFGDDVIQTAASINSEKNRNGSRPNVIYRPALCKISDKLVQFFNNTEEQTHTISFVYISKDCQTPTVGVINI